MQMYFFKEWILFIGSFWQGLTLIHHIEWCRCGWFTYWHWLFVEKTWQRPGQWADLILNKIFSKPFLLVVIIVNWMEMKIYIHSKLNFKLKNYFFYFIYLGKFFFWIFLYTIRSLSWQVRSIFIEICNFFSI